MSDDLDEALRSVALAEEMEALFKCLGERPEALEGAGIVIAHLGYFVFEEIHRWAHEDYPDSVPFVMVEMARTWMKEVAQRLHPMLPPGAHPL